MDEGKLGGRDVLLARCFIHDRTDAEVGQKKTVEVLFDEFRPLTAQQHARPFEVCLELSKSGLDPPSFGVQVGQGKGWSFGRIEQRGDDPVMLPFPACQDIELDHAYRNATSTYSDSGS